MWWG
jgi:hypothetical protein